MKLTVDGKDFNIDFDDFTEEAQIELYRKCPKIFSKFATKSWNSRVNKIAAIDYHIKDLESEELEEMILKEKSSDDLVERIWNNPNMKKTDELRRKLIKSPISRFVIAEDETTPPEILNEILVNEALRVYKDHRQAVYAVSKNPNLKIDEETREILLSKPKVSMTFHLVVNDAGTSSEVLNEIFKKQLKERKAGYTAIIKTILASPNFKMDKESRKIWEEAPYRKEYERYHT